MPDHEEREDHERDREDQLQTLDHEGEGAVGDRAEDAPNGHAERRHRHDEHDRHRDVEHGAVAARALQEHGERSEHQSREELVGRAEERPDRHVAREAEEIGENERQDRREVGIREENLDGVLFLAFGGREEFLQAHAADAGHGVHARA